MANANGKNGKNGNGKNGAGGTSSGSKASGSGDDETLEYQVKAERPEPAIVVPPRSMTPVFVGVAALAAAGGAVYAVHRWRERQLLAAFNPVIDPALRRSDHAVPR